MSRHALNRGKSEQSRQLGADQAYDPRGPRSGEEDEEMSRTGKLVISLQDQVETLTVAIRSLQRHLPAPLVSVHEAADRLGVSVNTVRRRVKSGEIPSTRIGKVVRVDLTNVRALDVREIEKMARDAQARVGRAR